MQGFHIPAAPPLYTNTFLLISDAGHAVVIDPAAEVHSYDEILKQHNATLTTILCTHGHYDHVGSAAALKAEWNATLYCEKADLAGDRMYPLSTADCGSTDRYRSAGAGAAGRKEQNTGSSAAAAGGAGRRNAGVCPCQPDL